MWTHVIVVAPPRFDDDLRFGRVRNHSRHRRSSRKLPLKLSVMPAEITRALFGKKAHSRCRHGHRVPRVSGVLSENYIRT